MEEICDLTQLFKEVRDYFEHGWKKSTQKDYDDAKGKFMTIYKHLFASYVNVCDGGQHPKMDHGGNL